MDGGYFGMGGNVFMKKSRILFASLIGSVIEWYDFYLYGTATGLVFSSLFSRHMIRLFHYSWHLSPLEQVMLLVPLAVFFSVTWATGSEERLRSFLP